MIEVASEGGVKVEPSSRCIVRVGCCECVELDGVPLQRLQFNTATVTPSWRVRSRFGGSIAGHLVTPDVASGVRIQALDV